MTDDGELWYIIFYGPYMSMMTVTEEEISRSVPKSRNDFNDADC